MKRKKVSRKELLEQQLAGPSQLFLYKNVGGAELILPKPTHEGKRKIQPREEFVAGVEFKSIRELFCLKPIDKRLDAQQIVGNINEKGNLDMKSVENVLLTEIPDIVTDRGVVEYVETTKSKKIKPAKKKQKKVESIQNAPTDVSDGNLDDILLNEENLMKDLAS